MDCKDGKCKIPTYLNERTWNAGKPIVTARKRHWSPDEKKMVTYPRMKRVLLSEPSPAGDE